MKKFLQQNRVFVIMMGIVLTCLIVILSLLFIYFYKGNNKDKYGNRLNDIKEVAINNTKDIVTNIKKDTDITEATVDVSGKIVYIILTFKEGITLDVAKGKALVVLDNFTEEELTLYDFQISLIEKSSSGYVISGAKNNGTATITWNNNRSSEE
jgi:hypothetical protein